MPPPSDDRPIQQQQIQTGAGLTESRLNTEFIDALKKFGPWVVILIAAAILAYAGWGRLKEAREARTLEAFRSLEEARVAGNPDNLVRYAEEAGGAGRVALAIQARLSAADVLLFSAARGTRPGASIDPQTGTVAPEDVLDDAGVKGLLDQAKAQYAQVLSATETDSTLWLHRLGAQFGLAAVAESTGAPADAKKHYQDARALAEQQGLTQLAGQIDERISSLMQLPAKVALISEAEVKSAPPRPKPMDRAEIEKMIREQMEAQARAESASSSELPQAMGPFSFPPTPIVPVDDAPAPSAPGASAPTGQVSIVPVSPATGSTPPTGSPPTPPTGAAPASNPAPAPSGG